MEWKEGAFGPQVLSREVRRSGSGESWGLPRGVRPPQNVNQPPPRLSAHPCFEKMHRASLPCLNPEPGEVEKRSRCSMPAPG